ncbi:MAG: hypothetical protein ACYDB7_02440 [Mycobacteriales bacterium]
MSSQPLENVANGVRATHPSTWDRGIIDLLSSHSREEDRILETYQRFAEQAESEAIRYLVRLIVADEQRHHQLIAEIANSIAWSDPKWSPEATVPMLEQCAGDADPQLLAESKTLLAAERRDHAELRQLRRQLRPVDKTTMWGLLVDLIIKDTEKHIRILQFMTKRALRG